MQKEKVTITILQETDKLVAIDNILWMMSIKLPLHKHMKFLI